MLRTASALVAALALLVGPLLPHLGHECECAKRELRAKPSCCAKKKEKKSTRATEKKTDRARSHDVARGPCGCCPTGEMHDGPAVAHQAPLALPGPALARLNRMLPTAEPLGSSPLASPPGARAPPGQHALHLLNCTFLI